MCHKQTNRQTTIPVAAHTCLRVTRLNGVAYKVKESRCPYLAAVWLGGAVRNQIHSKLSLQVPQGVTYTTASTIVAPTT